MKVTITRTHAEIAAEAKRLSQQILPFGLAVLIPYLPFDLAKGFLKDGVTEADWKPNGADELLLEMEDYMAFAWDKARDHKGISASRSVDKMRAWCWLIGRDDLVAICDDEDRYQNYGCPILLAVSEAMGFPVPEGEDLANMAKGLPCEAGCSSGCEE